MKFITLLLIILLYCSSKKEIFSTSIMFRKLSAAIFLKDRIVVVYSIKKPFTMFFQFPEDIITILLRMIEDN